MTGVTGKSGRFFYEELCKNAKCLGDYKFGFIVRDEHKAKDLLVSKELGQELLVGRCEDKVFINNVLSMGGV